MPDADDQGGGPERAGRARRRSARNPLLTVLVLANTAMVLAIGALQYSMFTEMADEPSMRELVEAGMAPSGLRDPDSGMAREDDGLLFPLDGFTANLSESGGARRFVRMVPVLKFSADSSEAEFQARRPQIRNSIINILNSKRPEDLLREEGKSYLKEEIRSSINGFLIDGEVLDVYYVSFQVN